jgi:hypothetical protein
MASGLTRPISLIAGEHFGLMICIVVAPWLGSLDRPALPLGGIRGRSFAPQHGPLGFAVAGEVCGPPADRDSSGRFRPPAASRSQGGIAPGVELCHNAAPLSDDVAALGLRPAGAGDTTPADAKD